VSELAKIEGIKTIINFINRKELEDRLPTILTGDFNSTIHDEVIKLLKNNETKFGTKSIIDAFDFLPIAQYGPTYHNFGKIDTGDPIDHLFASNDIKIHDTTIDKEKEMKLFISDHYPVSSIIEMNEFQLTHNYHTHNFRCGHAKGTVNDYVNEARKLGIKTIGFCDHVPFKDNRLPGLRMNYDVINDYLEEINHAKETYNNIEILSGFECEYFKSIHDYYVELKNKTDYLVLGQHYIEDNGYVGNANFQTKKHLLKYALHIEEALDTKLFSLLVHPDCFGLAHLEFDETSISVTHRICLAARKNRVTIELNSNGFRRFFEDNTHPYPLDDFWKIVSLEYGDIPVLITSDAHEIKHLSDDAVNEAVEYAKKYNLNIVDKLILK